MHYIYKVCDGSLWDQAVNVGYFAGAEIDLQDGYIHFSTAAQLADTLAKHFAGRTGLCLLRVDPTGLAIKWEMARGGDLFPHLYDLLPLSAVEPIGELALDSDGVHQLPSQL